MGQGALAAAGSSLVLPSVAGAAARALPHSLAGALGAAPLRVDGASLRQLRLNASLPALLLLRLPHSAGSSLMGPREVLSSNDEVLGQVLSALQEEGVPYTAVLTALRPSHEPQASPRSPQAGGRGRALLQAAGGGGGSEVAPPLRWPPSGPPRVLLWAQNFTVSRRGQRRDLTPRRRFLGGGRPPPPPWAGAAGSSEPPAPSCCPAAPPATGGCCWRGCRCRPSTSPGGRSGG